ncbi:MAG: pseudouridine synthase [Cellulomonadaceae bacterium]|jgi:tRNA pseudouridine32 synthase/23S rRNA pseudouridine746 synthase|nr:pseudouridine synthase [Cellulomonadaceae bacterium]
MTRTLPLPVRNGLNPTRVVIPGPAAGAERTVLEYLLSRFPDDEQRLREKVSAGEVVDGHGGVVTAETRAQPGASVWLYRDPPIDEPHVPELSDLRILYQDDTILVVDKPHNVAVTPRGQWVTQTLLVRLRVELGLPDLSPAHRLDRPTAGVLLLTVKPDVRGRYQMLFENRLVTKEYEAVAAMPSEGVTFPRTLRSRIVKNRGVVAAQEVPGKANAETWIGLIRTDAQRERGLYLLQPHTGKTHQLRVHMNSLGLPILHDPFFPEVIDPGNTDPARPLQLLARSLEFCDPMTGESRVFRSQRTLVEAPP